LGGHQDISGVITHHLGNHRPSSAPPAQTNVTSVGSLATLLYTKI